MNPNNMTMQELLLYSTLVNAGIGFALGLVPLVAGFVKGNQRYGFYGFAGSIIGGAILGLILAIPVAVIFTWLIIRGPNKPKNPAEVVVANPDTINVDVVGKKEDGK